MKKSVYFIILLIPALFVSTLQAQQVVSSAGAQFENASAQLSWTLGEPVIETYTNASTILTQGFQQTKFVVTAIDLPAIADLQISVYPNPVIYNLKLEISGNKSNVFQYRLSTIDGKILEQKELESQSIMINMADYPHGIYLLVVYRNKSTQVQSFKIIKN
jgi:hypothetical protein